MKIFVLIFIFVCSFHNGYAAKILGLFPFQGKSHYVMFEALMIGLAERGHEVDVVNHYPQKQKIPRFNDISVRGTLPIYVNNITMDLVEKMDPIGGTYFVFDHCGNKVCDALFKTPVIRELYETKKKYDLVITEIFGTDCFLVFAHKLGVPSVGVTSSVLFPWASDRFGDIDNPSFVPVSVLPFTSEMNLYQRVINTIGLIVAKLSYDWISNTHAEKIIHEEFGKDLPSIYDMQNNMSLLILNSHFSLNQPRPTPPNVIEVAGLHIRPTKELPTNFAKVLEETKNGIILFSMGSMIRTETFDVEKQRALIEAFGQLPYTIYWKGERDKFPGPIPENIIFETWLPQQEILCHPKTKLFITHGGLMGTQEAVFCGVPMVGIPFFGDQQLNIRNYEQKGIAKELSYSKITKDNTLKVLKEILDNPSYQNNVKKMSALFRDRPMSAIDTAIYWIEYVIRHKGAPHLRPANVHLSWYQLYLYDVFLVIFSVICLIVLVIYMLVSSLYKQFIKKTKVIKEKLN